MNNSQSCRRWRVGFVLFLVACIPTSCNCRSKRVNESSFVTGTGSGYMAHANGFKSALVGAALGLPAGEVPFDIVTYNGKFILSYPNQSFQYDNRDYYWDRQFFKGGDVLKCSMSFQHIINMTVVAASSQANVTGEEFENSLLPMIAFPDGTHPKEIVWSCEMNIETCCGIECCQTKWGKLPGIVRFFIAIALILIFFGSICILQTLCRFGCQHFCTRLRQHLPQRESS